MLSYGHTKRVEIYEYWVSRKFFNFLLGFPSALGRWSAERMGEEYSEISRYVRYGHTESGPPWRHTLFKLELHSHLSIWKD